MKIIRALFLLVLAGAQVCAQPQRGITSLLVCSWFADFSQPDPQPTGLDLSLFQAAQAARQGRFIDAGHLLQAAEGNTSQRAQLLRLLFQRIELNLRFSLVGGGFGNQRKLQLDRLQAGPDEPTLLTRTTALVQRFPPGAMASDAQAAAAYFPVADVCQTLIPTLLRGSSPAAPPPAELSRDCRMVQGNPGPEILSSIERTVVEKATLGALAAATGDVETAQKLFIDGRSAAVAARLPRSQAEFDLRLGDLYVMPFGHWMTLGYNLASEGLTRAILSSGALPKSRNAPTPQALAQAEKWYTDAARIAGASSSDELVVEIRFRQAGLTYLHGNTPGAVAAFSAVEETARRAGSVRAAAMAGGIAAILGGDEAGYRQALRSLGQQGDVGGAGSLIETAESYAAILRFRGDPRGALAVTRMTLRAAIGERVPVLLDGVMSSMAALSNQTGDPDLRLYWARAAVAEEEQFIADSSKYFLDPGFLQGENGRLQTLLNDVVMELFSRTLTEPNEYWSNQLAAYEKRIFIRDDGSRNDGLSDMYRRMKSDLVVQYGWLERFSKVATCEPTEYQGLRAELVQAKDAASVTQLDQLLGGCGDPAANAAARERLRAIDVAALLQTVQNASRRETVDQQHKFAQANLELSMAIGTALGIRDFDFVARWLDKIESVNGPGLYSYFARLSMLLGTNHALEGRNQALRIMLDPVLWKQMDDRVRMGVLTGLVEAYAQLKDPNRSLAALLTLWREQARLNHTDPGPEAAAVLRRAALLRTPIESLSAQQKEELRGLCLANPADNGAPTMVDPSPTIAAIPPQTTVLVYFVGSRTWVWRLGRGAAPVLVPLGESRDFNVSLTRFLNKFTGSNTRPGWEADSVALYDRLVKPAGEFRAREVLAIAGAGYFRGLSFDALGPSGGKLLGEQFPIVYVEDLLANPPPPRNVPRRPAIIGSGGISLSLADDEARQIAALLGVPALIGPGARRAAVADGTKAATWIHFSTHGAIDWFNPYRSYLALADNEQIQGFELPAMVNGPAMITFSACNSNVSFVRIGEVPQPGFARGLTLFAHAAGTQWVLSSLWRADESASRELMVAYYRQLLAGQTPAIALFNAKSEYLDRERRSSRRAPWYWSGFALSSFGLAGVAGHP